MQSDRSREHRLRRKLGRNDYKLCKTPAGSSQREWLGVGFMVVDVPTNCIIFGSHPWPYAATLDQVEHWAREL